MSDIPPENDPLGLFGAETDQPATEPEDPLWQDLKLYDNPEAFSDVSLPQKYRFGIRSLQALQDPSILNIEVDGDMLPTVVFESLVWLTKRDPAFDGDDATLRSTMIADDEYWALELGVRRFFLRHLPKILIHGYNIAINAALLSEVGHYTARRAEREELVKTILADLLSTLEKDIKQMLATRSIGRPKVAEDRMPKIVERVLNIVREIMQEKRGKEAVPVLKTVADKLDLSETALRKRLVRAGHPWDGIKRYFENLS